MERHTKNFYNKIAGTYHNARIAGNAANNEFLVTPAVMEMAGNIKGKRVLDLGCGTGIISRKLKNRGAIVCGLDLSPGMLELARSYAKGIDFVQGSAENMPFKPDRFDLVVSVLVFDYTENIDKAFRETWRVMKNNGYFVLAIRNPITTATKSMSHVKIKGIPKYKMSTVRQFSDYFNERLIGHEWWKKTPELRVTEYDMHRTYQTIIRTMIRNGFEIVDYVDPKPKKGYKGKDAKWWYSFSNSVPSFCIFKLKKVTK